MGAQGHKGSAVFVSGRSRPVTSPGFAPCPTLTVPDFMQIRFAEISCRDAHEIAERRLVALPSISASKANPDSIAGYRIGWATCTPLKMHQCCKHAAIQQKTSCNPFDNTVQSHSKLAANIRLQTANSMIAANPLQSRCKPHAIRVKSLRGQLVCSHGRSRAKDLTESNTAANMTHTVCLQIDFIWGVRHGHGRRIGFS